MAATDDGPGSLGADVKTAWIDDETDRGNYTEEVLLGPSFQFRPLPNAHIDFAVVRLHERLARLEGHHLVRLGILIRARLPV